MRTAQEIFIELTGDLDFPMLLITTVSDGERAGCLVGFSTQCSIDPPRFIVCVSEKNRTLEVASRADGLAVHIVPADATELAELFGSETGDEVDKFSRCGWHPGPHGLPILADCPRWFVGTIRERYELGDHTAFVLDPVAASTDGNQDHLFFSQVKHLEPGHEA